MNESAVLSYNISVVITVKLYLQRDTSREQARYQIADESGRFRCTIGLNKFPEFYYRVLPELEAAEQIDRRVHESVQAHRISDVKVGSFLSGGVDSSYITAVLMPNDTFSVGFNFEKFDETSEAKELSERLGVANFLKHILIFKDKETGKYRAEYKDVVITKYQPKERKY